MICPKCKSYNVLQLGISSSLRSDLVCLDCDWDNLNVIQSYWIWSSRNIRYELRTSDRALAYVKPLLPGDNKSQWFYFICDDGVSGRKQSLAEAKQIAEDICE